MLYLGNRIILTLLNKGEIDMILREITPVAKHQVAFSTAEVRKLNEIIPMHLCTPERQGSRCESIMTYLEELINRAYQIGLKQGREDAL